MPSLLRGWHGRTHGFLGAAIVALVGLQPLAASAEETLEQAKRDVRAAVEARSERSIDVARQIWEFAELGYQEAKSSRLLQSELASAGFSVEAGVAEIPTAFIATFGSGQPVVGILAEFDALPGLSQAAVPRRQVITDGAPGHACGHHLFGAGSVAAAIAVKGWMEGTGTPGTLRLYGTPAEEGGAAKAYMARAGLFADVDAALHWHPRDRNQVSFASTLANKSAKFRFRGEPAHASSAPERGRSALDGVEAMSFMVNLLREHVPEQTRIHYIITQGGDAPNIVPENAELFLYARHPDARVLLGIWQRIVEISEGAAKGTGTTVEHEVIHGSSSVLPNDVLLSRLQENLEQVGGVEYDAEELAFAEALYETLREPDIEIGSERDVQPPKRGLTMASTDVGDVSWNTPTAGLRAASWVPGTAPHSWQAVAAGGTSIGSKGMLVAARTLAATAVEIFSDAGLRRASRAEFEERIGPDYRYVSLLGDRDPPLDYREN